MSDGVDPVRKADSLSTRRSKIGKTRRKEFDSFYGKPKATRGSNGAGKGDATRPTHARRYELGYKMLDPNLTDEEREEMRREWKELGRPTTNDSGSDQ